MSLLAARDLGAAPPADGSASGAAPDDPVVRGFSLEVGSGEWVAVTGPNGCGKTCLLLTLAGLWPARSGEVLLEGRPLGPQAPSQRRSRVAVVMQDPSSQLVQPTVREEIGFAAANLGVPEAEVAQRVLRWSDRLGLAEELDRDPQALSAGRQQLVLIGAALASDPAVLLADEPAAHLDAMARALVLRVIREEVVRGLAVVWVTQDAGERAAADRVVGLGGREFEDVVAEPPGAWVECEQLARVRVSPWNGSDGPAVRTDRALEIVIPERGVTAVEGSNGTGKSVLLRAAAGVAQVAQIAVDWRSGALLAPLISSQYPELEIFEERVEDELTYAAVSRGVPPAEARARAGGLLGRLAPGGSAMLGRRTWSLSGGEKRLVSLVGAIIAPAGLLILDEPTAGLDDGRRTVLAAALGEVAQSRSVLVASQDSAWLRALSARRYRLGDCTIPPAASHSKKTD